MDRRNFFRALSGGAATALVGARPTLEKPRFDIKGSPFVEYQDPYVVKWTGFKEQQATADLVGQFVVFPKESLGDRKYYYPLVYSATSGGCGMFSKGDVLDCCLRPGQEFVTAYSSEKQKAKAMQDAFLKLNAYMGKVLNVKWEEDRRFTARSVNSWIIAKPLAMKYAVFPSYDENEFWNWALLSGKA